MQTWSCSNPKATMIIVHGAGEHHRRYEWLAEQWNRQGVEVIMGDLPGQGKTRGKRGHIQSFKQYIDTVYSWYQEAEKSNLPIFILGHSMGGLVVIRTIIEKKLTNVSGVILSSPCLGLAKPPSKFVSIASKAFNYVAPSFSAPSNIRSQNTTRNEEVREQYSTDELRVRKVSIRWYQELLKAIRISHRETDKWNSNLPLLVLQAGDELVTDKNAAKQWFNTIESHEKIYKEWSGLYHELFNEPERNDVFTYAKGFVQQKL
ncbi:alpha/beta hydrolase [Bacillus sp. FJAT-45350]|uniref:alpha/beta hydrolase n=1 Tax=Bacillus sp. FJAT-45350 TaxID=2011014 RepID=UPI000BB74F18|nr:alpha/beta hydrolase [Bacillus sp. FJAT-45350]